MNSLITVAQDFINNYSPELPFGEEKKFNNLLDRLKGNQIKITEAPVRAPLYYSAK